MKNLKLRCAAALVAVTAMFSAPNVLRLGTLKEFSLPYTGEYRCEVLRICQIDFVKDLDVRLELSEDGQLTVRWKNAFARERSVSYPYEYDADSGYVTVTVPDGKSQKKVRFSLRSGEIVIAETLSGKAFFAKFSRK
jgi:hypothetical protein